MDILDADGSAYLAEGLITGSVLTFKVTARNVHGYSDDSNLVVVLVANKPVAPLNVQTTVAGPDVVVSWDEAVDNGSPLTAYKVFFRRSIGAYAQETIYCDGTTDSEIVALSKCNVPMIQLTQEPFNLILGDSIDVKIISVNQYGDSEYSAIGTGAVITLVPDAPINFSHVAAETEESIVSLVWSEGVSNGGSPVIAYYLQYKLDSETEYIDILESIVDTNYQTKETFVSGEVYNFRVQARNTVGYSSFSDVIAVRVARVPDPVSDIQTQENVADRFVLVTWENPYDGGSPIFEYLVEFLQSDGVTYTRDSVHC